MLLYSFAAGFRALRSRPGLAVLLFLVNLAVAVILAVPLGVALSSAVANTGFDTDLASGLDLVLIVDIVQANPDIITVLISQLIWIIPLVLVWKAAMGVGLIHALRGDSTGSFWTGVGRYFGRAFAMGLMYMAGAGFVILAAIVVGMVVNGMSGEVWTYRAWAYVVPLIAVFGLAKIDLMHDFGRIAIVLKGRPVFGAFIDGVLYPFRHGRTFLLYLFWMVPAALFWLLPTVIEATVGASLAIFIFQQILLLGRAGVTVSWIGSEVAFFEASGPREPVWIDSPVDGGPETAVGFA